MGANAAAAQRLDHLGRGAPADPKRHQPLARGVLYTAHNFHTRQFGQPFQIAGAMQHGMAQCRLVGVNGLRCRIKTRAPVCIGGHLRAQPIEIADNIAQRGIGAGIAGAKFPIVSRPAQQRIMGQVAQPVRQPGHTIAMAREHFIGRDRIAIHAQRRQVNTAMGRVLDAIDNDQTLRRHGTNFGGNRCHIHPHAGDRRGVQNGGNRQIGAQVGAVIIGRHTACGIVMGHRYVAAPRMFGPKHRRTARGGVFQRAANHRACGGCHAGGADHAKQHLGAAFAHNHLATGRIHEFGHIGARLGDNIHQGPAGRVIAALVIGDRGKCGAGLHDRIQRQRPAGIFEKHPRPFERAGIDMGKAAADFGKKIWAEHRAPVFLFDSPDYDTTRHPRLGNCWPSRETRLRSQIFPNYPPGLRGV